MYKYRRSQSEQVGVVVDWAHSVEKRTTDEVNEFNRYLSLGKHSVGRVDRCSDDAANPELDSLVEPYYCKKKYLVYYCKRIRETVSFNAFA